MWVLFDLFVHLVSWYFQWYVLGLFLFSILIFICGFVMQIMCLIKCFNKLFMSCEVISERIFIWNNDIVMMESEDYCHSECLYIPYIFFFIPFVALAAKLVSSFVHHLLNIPFIAIGAYCQFFRTSSVLCLLSLYTTRLSSCCQVAYVAVCVHCTCLSKTWSLVMFPL